jgi:hypothetical protein
MAEEPLTPHAGPRRLITEDIFPCLSCRSGERRAALLSTVSYHHAKHLIYCVVGMTGLEFNMGIFA